MTDVQAKVPTKRSLSDKEGPKGPVKKAKFTPKQNKTPNKLTKTQNNQNLKKQTKKNESENGSPKKLKPFSGTSTISATNKQGKLQNKANKNAGEENAHKKKGRKSRKNIYADVKSKVDGGNKESVIKDLEDKIQLIESRGELSKSAKKRVKLLKSLKNVAEGNPRQIQQDAIGESKPKKRLDRKKAVTSTAQASLGTRAVKKNVTQGATSEKNKNVKIGGKPLAKKPQSAAQVEEEEDSSEDVEEENESDEDGDSSGAEDELEGEEDEAEGESEEDSDDDEGEGEADSDEDGEEESDEDIAKDTPPPQGEENDVPKKKLKLQQPKKNVESKTLNTVNLEELKKNQIVGKNQKRFVVFVGNIPYDTNKQDLIEHFQKCGEIKHIRIPTEKKSSKPRGFAYVEIANEESYQRCLSMHHTFLKGRRINVLYTQGGKKKGDDKKKEMKVKNFKLHAMRKGGKLVGSKKDTQKRSFRRAKQRTFNKKSETQE